MISVRLHRGHHTKAPRCDLADTKGYGGGNCFSLAPWMFSGYVGIYRRKKYVGGRLRGPGDSGRAQEGWAPSTLVGPSLLHRRTSSSYIYPCTPKTSREPTKNNFHHRNLLYPRDLILEPSPALCQRGESTMEGFYINILAPPMSCE